jgi:hypothetical protein
MKHGNSISILNTAPENQLLRRVKKLEQQLADLAAACNLHGITIVKCDFCGKVLAHTMYVHGPQVCGVNGTGVNGIALRDGNYNRYYCVEHIPEAYEDCADWCERDAERAEYAIASWFLRYTNKTTPPRVMALRQFPSIKEKILHLYP